MWRIRFAVPASLTVIAVLSLACSDSSGPSGKQRGMNGTWYVGYVGPLDEPDAGRGSCQITPNLVFTIDSSANGVVVLDTIGISSQLACMSGNQYQLDIRSSLAVVTDSSGDKHGVAFKVNGPSPDELLIFVFPDIGGDSIGGKVIDVDTLSGTLIGQSVWSANRL